MSAGITRNIGSSVLGSHSILITPPASRICIATGACSPCFSLRVCYPPDCACERARNRKATTRGTEREPDRS